MMTRRLRTQSDPEEDVADDNDHNRNPAAHQDTTAFSISDVVVHGCDQLSSTDDDDGGVDTSAVQPPSSSPHINANERVEREERSKALEKTYVHDVYDQIATNYKEKRPRPWPRVKQFLLDLEPGSLVCDVGCGNGKYLDVNGDAYVLGSDRCTKMVQLVAKERGHELLVCDNAALPFRDESFDAVLSIAVVHHFATTERRVQALRELARLLRIGGRLMITVWAIEQRHRKVGTRFESQDVLVPWHKPIKSSSEEHVSAEHDVVSTTTTTTTSDDDLLNYHAYTSGLDSEPYFIPTKHKLGNDPKIENRQPSHVNRHRPSQSSQSSNSDLSSPSNETCYSFVRRALQKWSSTTRTWSADDPPRPQPHHPHHQHHHHHHHQNNQQWCRPPWFLQSSADAKRQNRADDDGGTGTGNENENENANDIPIELHGVDSGEMCDDCMMGEPSSSSSSSSKKNSVRLKAARRTLAADSSRRTPPPTTTIESKLAPTTMRLKSKSLSDIISSMFAANFRSSSSSAVRKASQDSTTSGSSITTTSSTSLGRQSSSSSIDSRHSASKASRSSHVARSKSGHFTLAKVEEGNEQVASQATPSPSDHGVRRVLLHRHQQQQRWSVTGYPATTGSNLFDDPDAAKKDSRSKTSSGAHLSLPRRPRSLVLPGKELRIPRTLSAEDHKNGNTILPDLDSCLSFYGLTTGTSASDRRRCPSPPYVKSELALMANNDKCPEKTADDKKTTCEDGNACQTKFFKDIPTDNFDYCKVPHNDKQMPGMPSTPTKQQKPDKSEKSKNSKGRVFGKDNTLLSDILQENVINQIIVKEHLFPCHSMPNLAFHLEPEVKDGMTVLLDKYLNFCSSLNDDDDFDEDGDNDPDMAKLKSKSIMEDILNGSQMSATRSSCARNSLPSGSVVRRRSCTCRNIRHSFSCGDTTFWNNLDTRVKCLEYGHFHMENHGHRGQKTISKEDSLQSDTSVDSDDSVASVIAVQQERQTAEKADTIHEAPSPALRTERLSSTCSKDSSNHSDTSVDSEESCISVIAAPSRMEPEVQQVAIEFDNSISIAAAALVSPNRDDPDILSLVVLEDGKTDLSISISWEKYLDASQSEVLDDIFYVNANHDGHHQQLDAANIVQLLCESCKESTAHLVSVEYYDCAMPTMAEVCWLDPTLTPIGGDESDLDVMDVRDGRPTMDNEETARTPTRSMVSASPTSSKLLSMLDPTHEPDSSKGRLLEAALEVATSLQDTVSVVVTSSMTEHIADADEEDRNPSPADLKTGSCVTSWMTTEMNPIYQPNSPIRSPPTGQDGIGTSTDTGTGTGSKPLKRNSRDVAVETDPTSDPDESELIGDVRYSMRYHLSSEKSMKSRVLEDVINGNVPGQRNLHDSSEDLGLGSSRNVSRRYSESYVNTSRNSLALLCTNKRFSFGAPSSTYSSLSTLETTSESPVKPDQKMSVSSLASNSTMATNAMQSSSTPASSIENHLGSLEFTVEVGETHLDDDLPNKDCHGPDDENCKDEPTTTVLSLSTSEDSILSGSENGGSTTFHRYYHVFREGELDQLIEKYVENLHIISSYYDHTNWCIVAEKVQVWRI